MPDKAQRLDSLLQRGVSYELIPAVRRDPRYEPWSLNYWAEWLLEPVKTEETLRPYTRALTGAFTAASWRDDLKAMGRLLGMLEFGYRYCREEPLLTPYESTLMFVTAILADRNLIEGRLAAALKDITDVERCLQDGDERRERLQMVSRPNSELRLNLIGLRAACMADPMAPAPIPLEEAEPMAREFWRIAGELETKLEQVSTTRRLGLLSVASRLEMEICKLAYKSDQTLFVEAVARFNRRYSGDLSDGAPLPAYAGEAVCTSWYWDLEVWKQLHLPERNRAALEQCKHNREATRQLNYGHNPQNCIKRYWERQAQAA